MLPCETDSSIKKLRGKTRRMLVSSMNKSRFSEASARMDFSRYRIF